MIKKNLILTLVILAVGFGSFAVGQQQRVNPKSESRPLDAKEMERLAAEPSLEQAILKMAADKMRQENRTGGTTEFVTKVRISRADAASTTCMTNICVNVGTPWVACLLKICHSTE